MIIAIGSNLPGVDGASPVENCARGLRAVAGLTGVRKAVVSRWYSSAPVPVSDQPRYVNGVVRLEGDWAPEALLAALGAIEAAAGRVRGVANAARILDLDIVDMGGMVRGAPDPVLPHPRAHLRGFVLHPLRDVAPGWLHPVLGVGVSALIAGLPACDLHPY